MGKNNNLIIFRCGNKEDRIFIIISIFLLFSMIGVGAAVAASCNEPIVMVGAIGVVLIIIFILSYRPIWFVFRKMIVDLNKKEFIACSTKGWIGRSYQKKEIIKLDLVSEIIFYYSYSDSRKKTIPDDKDILHVMHTDPALLSANFVLTDKTTIKVMFHHLEKNKLEEMKRYIKIINPEITIKYDFDCIK